MRFTLISARKDLTRLGRDPLALVTALGIPLVLVALITLVFGGRGDATPQGKLLIADEDETFVSRTIRSAFGNEPVSKSGFAGAPPLSDEGAAFLGIRFNQLARGLRKYLNPPLIFLKYTAAPE